jgi:integrase-like protein
MLDILLQENLAAAVHGRQKGAILTAPNQTVEQFLTNWLMAHRLSVCPRTTEQYEGFVRLHIVPVIGCVLLDKPYTDALCSKARRGSFSYDRE